MKYKQLMVIAISAILLLSIGLISGCTAIQQIDPCEREYTNCVHDCGEGILSSICKEKCTYNRNDCQESP